MDCQIFSAFDAVVRTAKEINSFNEVFHATFNRTQDFEVEVDDSKDEEKRRVSPLKYSAFARSYRLLGRKPAKGRRASLGWITLGFDLWRDRERPSWQEQLGRRALLYVGFVPIGEDEWDIDTFCQELAEDVGGAVHNPAQCRENRFQLIECHYKGQAETSKAWADRQWFFVCPLALLADQKAIEQNVIDPIILLLTGQSIERATASAPFVETLNR